MLYCLRMEIHRDLSYGGSTTLKVNAFRVAHPLSRRLDLGWVRSALAPAPLLRVLNHECRRPGRIDCGDNQDGINAGVCRA